MKKTTFALYFGNRGFFPGEVIASARKEMVSACEKNGYGYIIMDEGITKYGAVETIQEGKQYAKFLEDHSGEYDGVIVCLPNFGDENGASVALANVDVPILVQAYPDEVGKMDFSQRRDSLCGKMAMCNLLRQMNLKYTLTNKFTTHPLSEDFKEDLRLFAATCRVVKGMKRVNIGAIGARTTAFKTVRCDEIAFQGKRINIETIDMSMVFALMDTVDADLVEEKKKVYSNLSDFGKYPPEKLDNIAKLGVVIDKLIDDFNLQAVAIRCWDELQKKYGIAPCIILGELNERGIAAACELDITNAVMMRAEGLASEFPTMLLDVNNNLNDANDRAIFFHCGPAPKSFMKEKGKIEEHLMFRKTYGEGSGVGINKGEYISGDVTVGSFKTENGKLCAFVTEGEFTGEPIENEFFGCSAVFKKDNINNLLNYMAENGYRHHVCITKGKWGKAIQEAFNKYLGYNLDLL